MKDSGTDLTLRKILLGGVLGWAVMALAVLAFRLA